MHYHGYGFADNDEPTGLSCFNLRTHSALITFKLNRVQFVVDLGHLMEGGGQ